MPSKWNGAAYSHVHAAASRPKTGIFRVCERQVESGPSPAYLAAVNHRGPCMTDDEILAEFRAAGALLEGHFVLSSGKHSANYLQCARVLMNAERADRLARALIQKLPRQLRAAVEL